MKKLSFLRIFLGDLSTLWIVVVIAICGGFVLNLLRDVPLSLVYASKEERIHLAADRIAQLASTNTRPAGITLDGAQLTHYQANTSNTNVTIGELHSIDLTIFRRMQSSSLVLDARPEIFHRLGHVPKALSLPRDDFEAYYKMQRFTLEQHKIKPVAVYCTGGTCEDGEMVGNALLRLGFTQVYLFRGGWNEWGRAQLPEEKSL